MTSPRSPTFSTSESRITSMALVRDVGQECHLARPLDRERDLALVPAAHARDPARADLPLLGDVPPQLVDVLVVDPVDLLPAEVAALPPRLARGPAGALAAGGASFFLLCHSLAPRRGCRRRRPPGRSRRPSRPPEPPRARTRAGP